MHLHRLSCFLLVEGVLMSFGQNQYQLDEPTRNRLHTPQHSVHLRVDSSASSKRCHFENRVVRLLQSVGGRLDLNSFESRWKEVYPDENLCRNLPEFLHPVAMICRLAAFCLGQPEYDPLCNPLKWRRFHLTAVTPSNSTDPP
jgi:hypothetical protein